LAVVLASGLSGGVAAASRRSGVTVVNAAPTGSALAGHPYRHGLIGWRGRTRVVTPAVAALLQYGGGTSDPGYVSPIGVTTGSPRVYLVYWGSQWGSAGTDSNGYAMYSGDPAGIAPVQQAFFSGLGTGGELWSGVMTQYCEGVAAGATSCPVSSARVAYPTGGALAGVWEDTSSASPATATANELGAEAVAAATHFNNLTPAANRNVQYVIVSPTGADPDNYLTSGFCAWHDDTADPYVGVSSPDGTVAFTNMPYLPDVGVSCGAGFVNTPGALDGITIVGGHEYAETITDQFPIGGWTDSSQAEDGDKCAWISSGTGASQDITLTTGTFAVQSTWANDGNGGLGACEVSHPIGVTVGPTITSVAAANFASGQTQSFKVTATGGASTTVSVSGTLPSGISLTPGKGYEVIHGIAPVGTEGSYPLTVSATNAAATTTQSFTLWIVPKRKFTNKSAATFPLNVLDTFTVTAQGSFAKTTAGPPVLPVITEAGALPPGVNFTDNGNGTATLTGTPTTPAKYKIVITAAAAVLIRQALTITVK
jgi:serine protease